MYDALEGVRVVEVSMFAFVPSAGAVLSDWGADVVRVVHPDYGDPMQSVQSIGGLPEQEVEMAFMWEILNRGKRSIGIDLATPDGKRVLERLVRDADVFLTSFRTNARRKLGIDVDDIRSINPAIIYSRGTGQGARGPEADRAGFDHSSFWARSGFAHAASQVTGEFIPQVGPALGDLASGLNLAAGTVTALFKRERTGRPSVVDVSLFGSGVWMFGPAIVASGIYDIPTIPRPGHRDLPNPSVASYDTKDGRSVYLCGIQTDRGWQDLCDHLGRPELGTDPRFSDGSDRIANRKECIALLDEIFATRTLDEWVKALDTLDSAWQAVQSAQEIHSDPMAIANDYLPRVTYPSGASYALTASPVQFDEMGTDLRSAPGHGEQTDEILGEIGFSADEVLEMKLVNAVI